MPSPNQERRYATGFASQDVSHSAVEWRGLLVGGELYNVTNSAVDNACKDLYIVTTGGEPGSDSSDGQDYTSASGFDCLGSLPIHRLLLRDDLIEGLLEPVRIMTTTAPHPRRRCLSPFPTSSD